MLFNITNEDGFYFPTFTNYCDYDFRNAQALELLEDLFWEVSYPSYNLYDYIRVTQDIFSTPSTPLKLDTLYTQSYLAENTNCDQDRLTMTFPISNTTLDLLLLKPSYRDMSLIGQFYTNSLEADDFIPRSYLTPLKKFLVFPASESLFAQDESTVVYKSTQKLLSNTLSTILPLELFSNPTSSYVSVFNHFRSDYDDHLFHNLEYLTNFFKNESSLQTDNLKNVQATNSLILRSGVKNSIVTFNALRKVFRARFDEGRSHTSLQLFANSFLKQPFINDSSITYTDLLSKNLNTFYQNFLYTNSSFRS